MHSRSSNQRGVALVLVLLILLALTFAGVSLSTSTSREMVAVGRAVTKQESLVGADAGIETARAWFESQRYLGPAERVNATSITDPTSYGYWNTRNYGAVGDVSSATTQQWTGIVPDLSLNDGSPAETQVWYEVALLPASAVYSDRVLGEEAGRTVRYGYNVRSVARAADGATLQIEQQLRQTYSLTLYD